MSRITTQGRANPWAIPAPRRFSREGLTGPIEGMDYPRAKATAWNIIATAVWVVCGLYAIKLWVS